MTGPVSSRILLPAVLARAAGITDAGRVKLVEAGAVRGKVLILLALTLATIRASALDERPGVLSLRVADIIGPASADFIVRGLERARDDGKQLVVIELNTPGGLDTSMREIIQAILASSVPVVVFVSPEGARAASAGTYILYASHLAAMAPATNIGAATPVSIGMAPGGADDGKEKGPGKEPVVRGAPSNTDAMRQKVVNDASAYLRGFAELRGRDIDFAERAVREGASLSANQALRAGVVEFIAEDVPDLLRQIDHRAIKTLGGDRKLDVSGAAIETLLPDWRTRLLGVIANPQIALVLMMIGIYGLFFEFTSPGFGVPGVAGAIFLLLGLYSLQLLPINWAGVALLGVGMALILAEAFLPSFGALGVGGIIAMLLGGLFLMKTDAPGFGLPPAFLISLTLVSAAVLLAIGGFAARSRARPAVSGAETLVGRSGVVTQVAGDGSWAIVDGENWRIESDQLLAVGQNFRVVGISGLLLRVEPIPERKSG